MQTKTTFVLYIIAVVTIMTTIVGCVYEKQEAKQQVVYIKETKEAERNNIIGENFKKIETEIDKGVDTNKAIKPVSLGKFKLTAYCPCNLCCGKYANNRPIDENGNEIAYGAIGEELKEGYSIAVDPNVIPYRTEVIINGYIYKAQDCGGGINGKEIDIYFEDHNDALEFGVQYAEVFVNCENLN